MNDKKRVEGGGDNKQFIKKQTRNQLDWGVKCQFFPPFSTPLPSPASHISRASLRFEKWLNFSINPRKLSIFYALDISLHSFTIALHSAYNSHLSLHTAYNSHLSLHSAYNSCHPAVQRRLCLHQLPRRPNGGGVLKAFQRLPLAAVQQRKDCRDHFCSPPGWEVAFLLIVLGIKKANDN